MIDNLHKKFILDTHLNADFIKVRKSNKKGFNKKIKAAFPIRANPLFCSYDKRIVDHINKVGFCYFIYHRDYYLYDLSFCKGKEVWILYLDQLDREPSIKFGYALLRHGAIKVLVDFFPLEGINYVA